MRAVLVHIWSLFACFAHILGALLIPVSGKARFYLRGRLPNNLGELPKQQVCLFFCSSAGEMEQALPVMARLKQIGKEPVLFLFSESGVRFAKARDIPYPYRKAPADVVFLWEKVFRHLRPEMVVIVRYELWPSFLHVASKFSKVSLIDISIGNVRPSWLQTWLFGFVDNFYVIDQSDENKILASLGGLSSNQQVAVVGDTKYDRVLERANKLSQRPLFDWSNTNGMPLLVAGSVWQDDVELIAACLSDLKRTMMVFIVPHEPEEAFLRWCTERLRQSGRSSVRLSQWQDERHNKPDCIVVDRLGVLSELYGLAEKAWVGGALHHRVHNVLEPAVHGCDIAFGPNYSTSAEAKALVSHGLARVVCSHKEMISFLENRPTVESGDRLRAFVSSLAGASDAIVRSISQMEAHETARH